ncbi:MAG: DUF262 domain-containing protein [Ignavibacteriales bacterium]|nr:DUF262 domain-containing protein [Ignavibacteriales bacterium]
METNEKVVLTEDLEVDDESSLDQTVAAVSYKISSYGADYDVQGLVNRLRKNDIAIPPFQRAFVWKIEDASSFVESLLLGLPVPGIFLATERDTNKLLIIDGQQRLKTMQFFYDGFFDPKPEEKKQRVFRLLGVQTPYNGLTYEELQERDKRKLDNSILHATIIKQESPKDGDTSIYHIFHRLNAGGMILKPQEIRRAAFHGRLLDTINELNDNESWRQIFGAKSKRLKDEELILRFLALYFDHRSYKKPMEEFLNTFASKNKNPSSEFLGECRDTFQSTMSLVKAQIGQKAFRVIRGINAALFDSVMVGVARRQKTSAILEVAAINKVYQDLIVNENFRKAITDGTSDEGSVALRLGISTDSFAQLK